MNLSRNSRRNYDTADALKFIYTELVGASAILTTAIVVLNLYAKTVVEVALFADTSAVYVILVA